jgi:hypothetical protein
MHLPGGNAENYESKTRQPVNTPRFETEAFRIRCGSLQQSTATSGSVKTTYIRQTMPWFASILKTSVKFGIAGQYHAECNSGKHKQNFNELISKTHMKTFYDIQNTDLLVFCNSRKLLGVIQVYLTVREEERTYAVSSCSVIMVLLITFIRNRKYIP